MDYLNSLTSIILTSINRNFFKKKYIQQQENSITKEH